MNGPGKYEFENEDIYEGCFFNKKAHGEGVFKTKDGLSVKGNFEFGLITGRAILTHPDGKIEEGKMKNLREVSV